LKKTFRVDFSVGPEILSISLEGGHPKEMTQAVDALRDAYMKEIVNKEKNIRLRTPQETD